ncbi:MAG: hypothetical protein KIT31_40825, partial [Deltaproteobacteria bacterium]|nr:hypothetical protein [Deltaproteobacteria bacterium]
HELADACANGCEWTPELEDRERAGQRSNVLAIAGGIAGASAVVGGLLLYAHGRAERSRALTIAPTGKGAVVWFRF